MNKERLQQVRDLLMTEEAQKRFNMGHYFNDLDSYTTYPVCETAACIAGHAIMLAYPNSTSRAAMVNIPEEYNTKERIVSNEYSFDLAKKWLDLTESQAMWLFYGHFSDWEMVQIPISEAIAALDHLIAGGDALDSLEYMDYKV